MDINENNETKAAEERKLERFIETNPSQLIESKELAAQIVKILDSKKAGNIKVIEVNRQTIITDFFVIATGTSSTHLKSLAGEVEFKLKEVGTEPARVNGLESRDWIVIDYNSVIVHIFNSEMREYYKLEKLWSEGKNIDVSALMEKFK